MSETYHLKPGDIVTVPVARAYWWPVRVWRQWRGLPPEMVSRGFVVTGHVSLTLDGDRVPTIISARSKTGATP